MPCIILYLFLNSLFPSLFQRVQSCKIGDIKEFIDLTYGLFFFYIVDGIGQEGKQLEFLATDCDISNLAHNTDKEEQRVDFLSTITN